MVVGICGKMCSGKSIAASYLVERGYTLIDVDRFGHQSLEIHKQQLIDVFGHSIVDNTHTDQHHAHASHTETNLTSDTYSNARHKRNRNSNYLHTSTVDTSDKTTSKPPAAIDRKKLARLVFRSQKKLQILERIVHPTMIDNIQDAVHTCGSSDMVIDAALLFKLNLHRLCDMVFFIDTTVFTRIQRYRARNRGTMWSVVRAIRIFSRQRDITVNNLSNNVDTVVVRNNRSEQVLRATIARYIV